jgi:hypothetical protein
MGNAAEYSVDLPSQRFRQVVSQPTLSAHLSVFAIQSHLKVVSIGR